MIDVCNNYIKYTKLSNVITCVEVAEVFLILAFFEGNADDCNVESDQLNCCDKHSPYTAARWRNAVLAKFGAMMIR